MARAPSRNVPTAMPSPVRLRHGRLVPSLALAGLCASCAAPPPAPSPDRARLLAEAELAAGRPDVAARRYEVLLESFPDDRLALDGLARARLAAGRPEAALAALDRLDELGSTEVAPADRTHCRIWLAALDRLAAEDRLDEALALAARRDGGQCDARETAVARGRAQRARADADRAAGRIEEALAAYRSAADALGPETPVAVYQAGGELLIAQGRHDEAVEWLDRGLASHPRNRRLLALMVDALSGGLGPHP
jgi:tetratricopeptide (TPR) repeat protein